MDDQGPSFVIYHDPPEEEQSRSPTIEAFPPHKRVVFAEIKLPSWIHETNCDSALKHEMLPSTSENLPLSDSELPDSCAPEESKENIILRSLRTLCLKTPPRKASSQGFKSTPQIYPRCTPPASDEAPSTPSLPPDLKHIPRTYTTITSSSCSISPFRI